MASFTNSGKVLDQVFNRAALSDHILSSCHVQTTEKSLTAMCAPGLEIAQCMARFGSAVTVFAKSSEILGKEDQEAAAIVRKQLEADGVTFLLDVQYHLISNGGPEGHEIHIQLQKLVKG